MTIRHWLAFILIIVSGYFTFVAFAQNRLSYGNSDWQYYLYIAAPWILLILSIRAWHRCYLWRRMLQDRQTPPVLSRGKSRNKKSRMGPHILEHSCALLFLLSVAALLKQFSVAHIEWWIGPVCFAWITLRFVMARARS